MDHGGAQLPITGFNSFLLKGAARHFKAMKLSWQELQPNEHCSIPKT
jgi:hypothetical protein